LTAARPVQRPIRRKAPRIGASGFCLRLDDDAPLGGGCNRLIGFNAADLGANLIVMGASGHSRARELLLGGATRSVLRSMTVPVLMSH